MSDPGRTVESKQATTNVCRRHLEGWRHDREPFKVVRRQRLLERTMSTALDRNDSHPLTPTPVRARRLLIAAIEQILWGCGACVAEPYSQSSLIR